MFFYVAKNFTAALAGAVVRDVACEKCGCPYHYRMIRRGEGSGTAPYYLGQRSAERRAEEAAKKNLEQRLRRDIDPVPCPDCGWFQASMVRELRKRQLRWLNWTAWTLGALFLLVLVVYVLAATEGLERELKPDDRTVLTVMAGFVAAALIGPVLLRRALLSRRDPNRAYPDRPALVPGAPRAFKDGHDATDAAKPSPASTNDGDALTYQRQPPEVEPGGWVTVQLAEMPMPQQCCACLGPAHEVTVYEKSALVKVPLVTCRQCTADFARRRRRWITNSIIAFALTAAGVTMIPVVAAEFNPVGQIVVALVAGLIGWMVGAVLANEHVTPAKFGRFDATLNTLRIKFKNRDYARVFVAWRPPPPRSPQPQYNSIPIPRPARA